MQNKILAVLVALTLTIGCSSTDSPSQVGGKIIGGATGAVIGSQFGKGDGQLVAVAIGALLGAQLGGMIGEKMDARDRQLANNSTVNALETAPDNKYVAWHNPNNNHSGNVAAYNTVENYDDNTVCRDYIHTVVIDGKEEKISGKACRNMSDQQGQWYIKG